MSKTIEKINQFIRNNPEITDMLSAVEMDEIHEVENVFYMISNAFFLGYMKAIEKGDDK